MAFCPPSVIHGAPSGPTITPCGADRGPSSTFHHLPGGGIENAELARAIARVVNGAPAPGAGGNVVRTRALVTSK
jgi:hypothetical protein